MNSNSRFKIYLVLILLAGSGLVLAVPVLAQAHASARGDPLAPSAADNIIYVARSGDGSDGLSWATAFTDLQAALSDAESGDEIWVATGVYTPGTTVSDSFLLVEGVAIYGGFDPAGGADGFIDRDWGAYPTILSGDIGGDDTNTNGVVLTTTHIIGDNSYHVVMADGTSTPITGSTRLDGFTITAGQANGAFPDDGGGGYYCDGSGSGGECSPSLANVTFSGNSAGRYGGAMYNDGSASGSSNPSLANVTFSGNWADWGGAMYNDGHDGTSDPSLSNVTFSGNEASGGGAMYNMGSNGTSSPSLNNVTFSGNSAGGSGGAVYNYGEYFGTSSPILTNVTFSGNSANYGGAMYNYGGGKGSSRPSLANVTFAGNSAAKEGGAMCNGFSSPSLVNVILWGNTAIITGSQLSNDYGSVDITTSLVQGGLTGSGIYNGEYGTVIDGGGNLDGDPDFVRDPDPGPDGNWDGADDVYGDLRLGAGSPAVDAGTNSATSLPTDLDGNPRVVDGDGDGTATVDMGAYELQPYALNVTLTGSGSGTVSGDGISCATGSAYPDCSETYSPGNIVTLTASADSGSTFSGWGGACTGTGDCEVTMMGLISVTATFTRLDVYIPLVFR